MTIISRAYLQKLINVIGTSDIKVITGVRRSGKSELLGLFEKYLIEYIPNHNLIKINFSDYQYKTLRNADALYHYVEGKYDLQKQNFLLIDEVQRCEGFEEAEVILQIFSKKKQNRRPLVTRAKEKNHFLVDIQTKGKEDFVEEEKDFPQEKDKSSVEWNSFFVFFDGSQVFF